MSIDGRGQFSGNVGTLRAMLSACASFQALVQAASAADALAKIVAFGQGTDLPRPFAIVNISQAAAKRFAGGARDWFKSENSLLIQIEAPTLWSGTVSSQTSASQFSVSSLSGFRDDTFNGLALELTSGDQAGEMGTVSDFTGSTGEIVLSAPLPGLPGVGSTLELSPASVSDEMLWFMNVIGDIADELQAQSGTGGCLSFDAVRLGDHGRGILNEEEDGFCGAVLEIEMPR